MARAILGHPYSGALYGYFSDEIGRERSHTLQAAGHFYYKTLYGRNYEQYVEIALNFLLLYDEIWLTPADNFMPTSKLDPDARTFIPELGLHANWDDFAPFRAYQQDSYVQRYLADQGLRQVLSQALKIPERAWPQVVESAVYEAALSARKRMPLLCSPGRRSLIAELIRIDQPSLHPIMPMLHEIQFIESYRSLTGMALAPKSLDDLMDAKPDEQVRTYGRNFLEIAVDVDGVVDTKQVARLVREAMDTQRVGGLFAGALNWTAAFLRVVSLGKAGAIASSGSYGVRKLSESAGWYEFSGSIDRAIDKANLARRLEEALKNDE